MYALFNNQIVNISLLISHMISKQDKNVWHIFYCIKIIFVCGSQYMIKYKRRIEIIINNYTDLRAAYVSCPSF